MRDLPNPGNGVALYYRIKEILEEEIASGTWKVGEKLPSESELMARFDVSRATVRQAVLQLVQAGVLVRRQGAGTFVAEKKFEADFLKFYFPKKYGTLHKLISLKTLPASPGVAAQLRLAPGEPVHELYRIRYFSDEPAVLEHTFLVASALPGFDMQDHARKVLDIVQNGYGLRVEEHSTSLEPVIINEEEAKHFSMRPGVPGLLLTRIYQHSGKPLIYIRSLIRGDKCRLLIGRGSKE